MTITIDQKFLSGVRCKIGLKIDENVLREFIERQAPIEIDSVICVFAFRESEEERLPDIQFQFDQMIFRKGKKS